mgnify:CR=1
MTTDLDSSCWALTWGGAPGLRHSLGMGKPFGFGQLSIEIEQVDLRHAGRRRNVVPMMPSCHRREPSGGAQYRRGV